MIHQENLLPKLLDPFGRPVTYLRLSVTDRCDLRCRYCMPEKMTFLPKKEQLTIEELYRVSAVMMSLGIKKIRITGGEPLVRRDISALFKLLHPHIGKNLDELTLTTNGTLLEHYAQSLADYGIKRINVSLDSLDPERYRQITRSGDISRVFAGLDAAQKAGLHVKLNSVAMQGSFLEEVDALIKFAHSRAMDLTIIEEMPLGTTGHSRYETYLSLAALRKNLEERWSLTDLKKNFRGPAQYNSEGPAHYVRVEETGGILGFITPLSCNFCSNCNRVRIGSTGKLYPCMGQTGMIELRSSLRNDETNESLIKKIYDAIAKKPKGHDFLITKNKIQGIERHMSELGG